MKRLHKTATAAIAGLGLLALAAAPGIAAGGPDTRAGVAATQLAHGPGGGHGMMGGGMMGPGMMGPGMMGSGMMGSGMLSQGLRGAMGRHMGRGFGMMRVTPTLNLTAADVSQYFERHLAMHANQPLKLGKVKVKDKDTIVADIVNKAGELVRRLVVDRHTGWLRPAK